MFESFHFVAILARTSVFDTMFSSSTGLDPKYNARRETVFLIFAGIFLGSLSMLNILGLTKMIKFQIFFNIDVSLTVGVLAYPITFLCTDFISEFYGRKRANNMVWVGLLLNLWVLAILYIGDILPPNLDYYDSHGNLVIPDYINGVYNGGGTPQPGYIFNEIKQMTFASTLGSMIAYLVAQFVDVHIFHYLKRRTNGKHLWLRNNGSTLISQLVDSFAVILIAHYYANAFHLKDSPQEFSGIMNFIFSGYIFKMLSALLDTIPFYLGTKFLSKYLNIDPNEGYHKE